MPMPYIRRFLPLLVLLPCLAVSVAAQQPAVSPAPLPPSAAETEPEAAPTVDNDFIHQQFGEEFALVAMSKPLVRDIDGDGVNDLVIVARSKKPMIDAAEHNYKVIDPYYSFYGYGDPKLTSTFGAEDPMEKNLVILVIHGAGPEAWRSETPKSKFVIINLPFKRIAVRRLQKGKKVVNAIFAVEADASAGDSAVFWDGKTYRYEPIGTGGD
jgi:hypothetical protein